MKPKPLHTLCIAGRHLFTRVHWFLFLLILFNAPLSAAEPPDSLSSPPESSFNPLRATMLSAALPGLGQAYNKKYYKIPVIYAGFGTLAYFVQFNNSRYQLWRKAWVARVDGNPNTDDGFPRHSTEALQRNMNYFRRNLEVTYILGAALYLLNVLDATVDAHLMDFDVGQELSLQIGTISPAGHGPATSMFNHTPGLSLRIRF